MKYIIIQKVLLIPFSCFVFLLFISSPRLVEAQDSCPITDPIISKDSLWTVDLLQEGFFDCKDTDLVIDSCVLTLESIKPTDNPYEIMKVKSLTFKDGGEVKVKVTSQTFPESDKSAIERTIVQVAEVTSLGVVVLQVLSFLSFLTFEKMSIASIISLVSQVLFNKNYRKNMWGVVFNAYDKQPIPFAVLRLYNAITDTLVATTVSDLNGRYGFPVGLGSYYIRVAHDDYSFPSQIASTQDIETQKMSYKGERFEVMEDSSIDYSIPMDSVEENIEKSVYLFRTAWNNVKKWFLVGHLYFLIFLLAVNGLIVVLNYNLINLLFSIFYLLIIILKLINLSKKPRAWGVVYDSISQEPITNAFIKLFKEGTNELVDTKISNVYGKFQFFTPENNYLLLVAANGYKFPSQVINPNNISYNGSLIKLYTENGAVGVDIPVDRKSELQSSVTPFGGNG